MAKLHLLISISLLSLSLLTLPPPISAEAPPPQPPSSACKSTLYPKLCLSLLSAFKHSPSNSTNYGKFSVKQCLKHAHKLSTLIGHFLQTHKKETSKMSSSEINALQDCQELAEMTVEYLQTIQTEMKMESNDMSEVVVGRVESLLSAVVTNQQTCYDGLVSSGSGMGGVLVAPMSGAAELYSVSLGLVAHALGKVRKRRKGSGKEVLEMDWARAPRNVLAKIFHASRQTHGKGRILDELLDGGVHINTTVIVSPYGGANFTSISDAVEFAPNNSKVEDGYFVIYVKQGWYDEYVVVPRHKKNIMMIGDGMNLTVISGNRSVIDGWTTFNSATFAVYGERFVAIDMTFQNRAGPEKHQAVAVRNNADLSTFYRCKFEGYQDTLYIHSLRQFYRECDIYGTVDFIFGNSAAVFQNCNLYARKPMPNQKNAFTAQGRSDPNQNTGISIQNCSIQAAPDLAMDLNSDSNMSTPNYNMSSPNYLGRPWKDYSRTVIMQSYIGSLINPVGWLEWNGTKGLDTLYYGEYENYGPGANTTMRVQWPGYGLLNATQAMNFTVYNLTMGDTWLPYTSIPFSAGLGQGQE